MKKDSGQQKMIVVTGNPYIGALKILGRDQGIAFIFYLAGVLLLSAFFDKTALGESFAIYLGGLNDIKNNWLSGLVLNGILADLATFFEKIEIGKILLISMIGFLTEKFGFFVGHIFDAIITRIKTDKEGSLNFLLGRAFKRGIKSLLQDVGLHDPLCVPFMYCLQFFTTMPKGWISFISYFGALLIVVAIDCFAKAVFYWIYSRRLRKAGFREERYYESRFLMEKDKANFVFDNLAQKYQLGAIIFNFEKGDYVVQPEKIMVGNYHDQYLKVQEWLKGFNNRKPKVRIRNRESGIGDGVVRKSFQVIFTRARQLGGKELSQFNFFPTEKVKFCFGFSGQSSLINQDTVRKTMGKFFDRIVLEQCVKREFVRKAACDPEKMLVSVDEVDGGKAILEIKVYPNRLDLLRKAMTVAMQNGGEQTTFSKDELIFI